MNDYNDIIRMDRPLSNHPRMSNEMRAAQFSPFSALSGYEDAIKDAQKLTSKESVLAEDYQSELDYILSSTNKSTSVEITYFIKDSTKKGGYYKIIQSKIEMIDRTEEKIILEDGKSIKIPDIKKIKIIMS